MVIGKIFYMNESSEINNTMSELNNTNNIQFICHYIAAGWQKGGRKEADLSWAMEATIHDSEALACICASISSTNQVFNHHSDVN